MLRTLFLNEQKLKYFKILPLKKLCVNACLRLYDFFDLPQVYIYVNVSFT